MMGNDDLMKTVIKEDFIVIESDFYVIEWDINGIFNHNFQFQSSLKPIWWESSVLLGKSTRLRWMMNIYI